MRFKTMSSTEDETEWEFKTDIGDWGRRRWGGGVGKGSLRQVSRLRRYRAVVSDGHCQVQSVRRRRATGRSPTDVINNEDIGKIRTPLGAAAAAAVEGSHGSCAAGAAASVAASLGKGGQDEHTAKSTANAENNRFLGSSNTKPLKSYGRNANWPNDSTFTADRASY